MIEIAPYDPLWPAAFEEEAILLRGVLGDVARSVEHVGSTAVPGLAAKPVIDIQVAVGSLRPLRPLLDALASIGYHHVPLGDNDRVYPYFEKPGAWPHTHHVHLCEKGSEQERAHLAFRDYLRARRDLAEQYAALKRGLAQGLDGQSLASRERYSLAKTAFVKSVVAKAYGEGLPWLSPGMNG